MRIELWGDEVDSIRSFDTDSQRSVQNLDEAVIYPADELPGRPGKRVSFLEYFPPEDTLVFLDEPTRLVEKGEAVEQEFVEAQVKRVESGYEVSDDEMELYETAEIVKRMNTYYCIGLSALDTHGNGFRFRNKFSINTKSVNPYNNSFEMLTRDLKRLKRNDYRVILLSGSRTRAKRLAEDLRVLYI